MLLLRAGTEVDAAKLTGLGPTRHAIFLCQQSGATGGQAWRGQATAEATAHGIPLSSTDIEAKHSTKTVWVKSGQGFVGQRLTGNRGSFFSLFGTSGKGGLGGLEPANHGKGPRANLEDGDSYHTCPARKRAMHLPSFFFSTLPPSAT